MTIPPDIKDAVVTVNSWLKSLDNDDDRLQALEVIIDGVCVHCGGLGGGDCWCTYESREID